MQKRNGQSIILPFRPLTEPHDETIVLQASGQKKIWLIGSSTLIFVIGVLLSLAFGIQSGAYCFFLLPFVLIGGFLDTSKKSNIIITAYYLKGGTSLRRKTPWNLLGRIWKGQYDLLWESCRKKGGKSVSCKTAYGNFGRECLHNGRSVSIGLAIEWIEALRDASSENERLDLIRKFRGTAPQRLLPVDGLGVEEKAKALGLLKEYKRWNVSGERERKMEIRQYFIEKGWAFPPASRTKIVFGWIVLTGTLVFWIFFFTLLILQI